MCAIYRITSAKHKIVTHLATHPFTKYLFSAIYVTGVLRIWISIYHKEVTAGKWCITLKQLFSVPGWKEEHGTI
jgi:hypothetical protein